VLSACGGNSSLCWDTVYLLVRTSHPAAASVLAGALPCQADAAKVVPLSHKRTEQTTAACMVQS
jgi:hypothetical protein